MEKAVSRMTLVQKDLAGLATPEEEDRLHNDPRAWKEALAAMYRDLCDDFQNKKAQSLKIGNVVSRREYEDWKTQANKRKENLVAKIQYVKGLIREDSEGGKSDYWETQIRLMAEIRDELRGIRERLEMAP